MFLYNYAVEILVVAVLLLGVLYSEILDAIAPEITTNPPTSSGNSVPGANLPTTGPVTHKAA